MVSLAIWLAILWACFGVGAAALKRLRAQADGAAEEIPFAVAIGMGLLAYLVLAAGLLGQLKACIGIGLICALALLGARNTLRAPREIGAVIAGLKSWRWTALPLAFFFLAAFALSLIGALAPAADNDYDGLVYHLAVPKIYLRHGEIHPIPWLSHSNFPFTLEMLYLLGLLLRDQALAKLFHFGCGWLTVLAIFAFARRWWGTRAGWLGSAAFAAIPLVAWEMMSAYNELAFALYAFLAVYALSRWYEQRLSGDGWLWVTGLMCGLALGTKMLAGAVVVFVLVALLCRLRRQPARGRALVRILFFLIIAAAVASPWYIKSYRWTGNPVYPFFYSVFDGEHWSAARAQDYTQAQKAFGLGRHPLSFAALPWNLTMSAQAFFDQPQRLRAFNIFVSVFGPFLLALVPALLVAGPVGQAGRAVLWFALIYAAIWFGMSQNGRYLIPVLPGLCACAGLAASRLLELRGVASAAVAVALVLSLLSGVYASFILAAPAVRVAAGRESASAYLRRVSRIYPMFAAVNQATPPNARILVLGNEPRCFYLERDYLLGDHAEIFTPQELASPGSFLAALKRMGVTHLLMHAATLADRAASRGSIGHAVAGLIGEGSLGVVEDYGPLSLWAIADENAEREP